MGTTKIRTLERLALVGHAADTPWGQFWPTVAADVAAAEPHDVRR